MTYVPGAASGPLKIAPCVGKVILVCDHTTSVVPSNQIVFPAVVFQLLLAEAVPPLASGSQMSWSAAAVRRPRFNTKTRERTNEVRDEMRFIGAKERTVQEVVVK